MVASEQMRAEQFQEGLRLNIRAHVAPFMLRTYSEVVARALIIERESSLRYKRKEIRIPGLETSGQGIRGLSA